MDKAESNLIQSFRSTLADEQSNIVDSLGNLKDNLTLIRGSYRKDLFKKKKKKGRGKLPNTQFIKAGTIALQK